MYSILLISAFFLLTNTNAVPERKQKIEKIVEYEDVENEKPFPGPIQIMPIVQRDTKTKEKTKSEMKEAVEEIIRDLPTDDSFERIGKMLNNSYDKMNRDAAEGESVIRGKIQTTSKINADLNPTKTLFVIISSLIISFILNQ